MPSLTPTTLKGGGGGVDFPSPLGVNRFVVAQSDRSVNRLSSSLQERLSRIDGDVI